MPADSGRILHSEIRCTSKYSRNKIGAKHALEGLFGLLGRCRSIVERAGDHVEKELAEVDGEGNVLVPHALVHVVWWYWQSMLSGRW